MSAEELKAVVVAALEELKGHDIQVLDVQDLTDMTDYMIVASGASSRQLKALADEVMEKCKAAGHRPLGVEGQLQGEWILVDLGDVVVHIMSSQVRAFYMLEKLWSVPAPQAIEER